MYSSYVLWPEKNAATNLHAGQSAVSGSTAYKLFANAKALRGLVSRHQGVLVLSSATIWFLGDRCGATAGSKPPRR